LSKRKGMREKAVEDKNRFLSTTQRLLKMIEIKTPIMPGYYLCYVPSELDKNSSTFPKTIIKVIKCNSKRKWMTKSEILGWIGPLPKLVVDELRIMK